MQAPIGGVFASDRLENQLDKMAGFVFLFILTFSLSSASYLPPKILNTDPVSAAITSLDPPDMRGLPVYRIDFVVKSRDSEELQRSVIHRQYEEFIKLDNVLRSQGHKFHLPTNDDVSVMSLNKYLEEIFLRKNLLESTLIHDFLGINWDGAELGWFSGYFAFMKTLIMARVPAFQPEPPVIDWEDAFHQEFPFETYLYLRSLHLQDWSIKTFVEFIQNYTLQTPDYGSSTPNDEDVLAPGSRGPVEYPYHYTKKHPHFTPGGYLNSRAPRYYYAGEGKFNFASIRNIRDWLVKLHNDPPRRVLDIGTGNCYTAFAYADLYPKADVIGIDLSAPFIRFCRHWKSHRNSTNAKFYQANAENTPFPSESFDVVHFSYVLHEMPAENSRQILREAYRLLTPGGALCGFEVPYRYNPFLRNMAIKTATGGVDWDSPEPENGPEPFMKEYQSLALPFAMQDIGFVDLTEIPYSYMDHIYMAKKPFTDQIKVADIEVRNKIEL
ncbi:uncharacterized protein [Ptychodera flava]|uniref:uncharacterized protein n=1 Tax=Ptychodera flava TaxID=63121 RepID=UPI00396A3063